MLCSRIYICTIQKIKIYNMKTMNVMRNEFGRVAILLGFLLLMITTATYAHCDSYDGPVIQDAYKALDAEDVSYVFKWISEDQEEEIEILFNKIVKLKDVDVEIYQIVEKHFLETLVRLHRETEGAPFTGLKPAGSVTPVVQMADRSIENEEMNTLWSHLGRHIEHDIRQKFENVSRWSKVKDHSIEEGRAYVEAYVEYTHTLEAIEHILAHGGHH